MSEAPSGVKFAHYSFGLIVTGKGERSELSSLFRSLMIHGACHFSVLRQVPQRSPRTSERRNLKMVNTSKSLPDKDTEEIGLPARRHLSSGPYAQVVLIDDLEHARVAVAGKVFDRYRMALDSSLGNADARRRASVHFLVNMLEAYFLADAASINAVLGTSVADHAGDVESIRNPKAKLKEHYTGYRETEHGVEILKRLDVPHVLSDPATCASLRTLFKWCWTRIGEPDEDRFCLRNGNLSAVTAAQIVAG